MNGIRKMQVSLICLLCTVFTVLADAQVINMSTTTSYTCTGTFYDSGGSGGQYPVNQNLTQTICSSTGQAVRVAFTSFRTQGANDFLTIYDGNNVNTAQWAVLSGTAAAGSYTASTNNNTGCLTFVFKSDATNGNATNSAGWAATISCAATPGAPPPNADCVSRKALCGTTNLSDNGNGAGNTADITATNGGCFTGSAASETQSSWYTFTMANSGTFNFTITPNNNDDDDWALWGPNPTCPPSAAPLRCTVACFSTASGTCTDGALFNPVYIGAATKQTGMNASSTDVSEAPTNTGSPRVDGFVKQINVLAGEQYVLMVNNATNTAGGGFGISFGGTASLTNCPSALPVELMSFYAKAEKTNVRIEWQTASEQNSAYYVVERSKDGVIFDGISPKIKAAGYSSNLRLYTWFDNKPFPGTNYYRLRQVDNDNTTTYSSVAALVSNASATKMISLYPNPLLQGSSNIEAEFICEQAAEELDVLLKNAVGQTVYGARKTMTQGYNKLSVPAMDLPAGIYLLQVSSQDQTNSYKVLVE